MSKVIKQLCDKMQITQTFSAPYQPESNGRCERFNETIIGLLRALEPTKKGKWQDALPSIYDGVQLYGT